MNLGPLAARAAWHTYWTAMRHYHRFEVRGLENVERSGPALIVGYHGRGVAHDMIMLASLLYERSGAEVRAIIHQKVTQLPVLGWIPQGLGYVPSDGPELADVFARGESLMVTPAGPLEGCRSFRERYKVKWGKRLGYLKLALKYRLPIIPTAGIGVDDTYIGLNDGYEWGKRFDASALAKRIHWPGGFPMWFAFGATGPWPMTLPFPVKITCHVGKPIDLEADGAVDPSDRKALELLHDRIMQTVQGLLDEGRRTHSA
jgi:1-acyl-sn-glycerol-3-phosphate acyltransferase